MQAIKEGMSLSLAGGAHAKHTKKRIIHKNRKHTQTRKRLYRKLKSNKTKKANKTRKSKRLQKYYN